MPGKPYQSCLVPFEKEIIAERRKNPPMPFSQIAKYMEDMHQIKIGGAAIRSFLQTRAKGFKPCKFAETINARNADQTTPEVSPAAAMPKQAVSSAPKPMTINRSKPTVANQPKEKTNLLTSEELTAYFELTGEEQSAIDKMLPKEAKVYIQQLMAEKRIKGE
jgi:uncharacterized protein (DUF4415 family)